MWLTILLSLLGVILKKLLEKWLGAQTVAFTSHREEFMGRLLARRNPVVAGKLFDHLAKQVEQIPAGTTFDLDLELDKAKDKVKADLG